MSVSELVILKCGHWFIEHRPNHMTSIPPELPRACGSMEHYPKQYPALYFPVPQELKDGWK